MQSLFIASSVFYSHTLHSMPTYRLCSTPSEVDAAVSRLCRSPQLIVDCQGYILGNPDGVLSLICVAAMEIPLASVYLFDVRSPAMAADAPSARGFLEMMRTGRINKIMWNCRQDALHIHALYGVKLHGVLDLQLAEMMARGSTANETDDEKLARQNRAWSEKRDINRLEEFHSCRGTGMQECVDKNGIASNVRNDCTLILLMYARVRSNILTHLDTGQGTKRWKDQPIPYDLLRCAVNDIRIVCNIYTHALRSNWLTATLRPVILEQGTRLVTAALEQREMWIGSHQYPGAYIPLDVLVPPVPPLQKCDGCGREISSRRFGPWMCELCSALGIWKLDTTFDEDDLIYERTQDYQLYRGTFMEEVERERREGPKDLFWTICQTFGGELTAGERNRPMGDQTWISNVAP